MKDNNLPLKLVSVLADGEFHSCDHFGISYTAINQHIQTIKEWGIDVFTVMEQGYCLPTPIELLDEKKINMSLEKQGVFVIPIIDSTNQYLVERINTLQIGDACVAEYQKAGRGRRGRKWFSPFGANLYISMYWRFDQGSTAVMGLSLVIGIVIADVLQQVGAKGVKIKWPNDLYLNDRKLAGILVEIMRKNNDVAHIVFGIGINLTMRLSDKNKTVKNKSWINLQEVGITINRNELVISLINQLRYNVKKFEREGLAPFIARWKYLDNFANRSVKLLIGDHEVSGIARGINSQGGLLLEQNGIIKAWLGDEISLRPLIHTHKSISPKRILY